MDDQVRRIRAGFGWNRIQYHARRDESVLLKVSKDQLESLALLAEVLDDLAPKKPVLHRDGNCVHCYGGTQDRLPVHTDDCSWLVVRKFIEGRT